MTVAYLIVSAIVLAVGREFAIVGGHVVLAVTLLAAEARDRRESADSATPSADAVARLVVDFLPAIVTTAIAYREVPIIVAILGSSYHDALVRTMEVRLFDAELSQTFAKRWPLVGLSEVLHAGYLAFYPAIYVPPLLLYARRERRGSGEAMLAFASTWFPLCIWYWVFPVEGPRFLWGPLPGVPDGPMRRFALELLAMGSARGAAFPSLHMGGSVALAVIAWRWQRPLVRYLVTLVAVVVAFGAVYAGFHYAIDILCGTIVGLLSGGFALWWGRETAMQDQR